MGKRKRKKCHNCKALFVPDPRKKGRHFYCKKDECRKASKAASQKKWLNKPENRDYFSCPDNVKRVQEWRKKNPGYWKRSKKAAALQDLLSEQPAENNSNNTQNTRDTLQDLLSAQPPVILGLISNFIGSALQEEIASTLLRMQQFGQDILYLQPTTEGGQSDCKNPDSKTAYPQGSKKLQLGRSPAG